MNQTEKRPLPAIVGIGEALFDVYPGRESLGGAPLNFSVHANRFGSIIGKSAAPVSRVGNDARGARLRSELAALGISDGLIQTDTGHPTGTVSVDLEHLNEAQYVIERGAAWDFLEMSSDLEAAASRCEAVCFGTLAQRSANSQETIEAFLASAKTAVKIFDVNLRQDFYDYSVLRRGCALSKVLKLNRAELDVLVEMLNIPGGSIEEQIARVFDKFPLEFVLLTQGSKGTLVATPGGIHSGEDARYDPASGADSVGAGDAAAAAATVAILAGLEPERIASVANHAGAFVASQHGALPEIPQSIISMVDRRHGRS